MTAFPNFSSVAAKSSCCRMVSLLVAFVSITLLGASLPALADGFTYEGTYSTGNTYYAYENSGTQIETATISMAPFQAQFSHPNDYIIIDAITPVGFTSLNGDLDDVATNLQYLSGSAILGSTHLSKTGSDTVTLSWLPVDRSGINDGDSGLWLGTFDVDFTFYGYPNGYPGTLGPYPEMYMDLTFGAQVNDTPEPGSLILLGTGLLGMAGMLRRKLRRG